MSSINVDGYEGMSKKKKKTAQTDPSTCVTHCNQERVRNTMYDPFPIVILFILNNLAFAKFRTCCSHVDFLTLFNTS